MSVSKKIKKELLKLAKAQNKTQKAMIDLKQSMKKSNKKHDRDEQKSREKHDKDMEEYRKSREEADKRFDKANKKWESFMGNTSEMTEEYFYRSLEENKTLGTLKFNEIDRNVRQTANSVEFDIILINGDSIGIIEVKNKAHPKDIKPLIEKKIKHFKSYYPEYKDYKYYFGIATMITNKKMIQEAKDEGIFLLTQKKDHLEIVNVGFKTF